MKEYWRLIKGMAGDTWEMAGKDRRSTASSRGRRSTGSAVSQKSTGSYSGNHRSRSSGNHGGNHSSGNYRRTTGNSISYGGSGYRKNTGRKRYTNNRSRRRRKRRNRQIAARVILFLAIVTVVSWAVIHMKDSGGKQTEAKVRMETEKVVQIPPEFDVELLDINDYSRPAQALEQVRGIVIHYTANPGTTAKQNRDYFNGLKDTGETKASSHFIVGMEGEIVQCIPTAEIAYASNERNSDTLAIECCIEDETGKFNDATYRSLVHLVAWLCGKFELNMEDVIRHYDVTGKNCPKYFVEHEDAWQQFKEDVRQYIESNGAEPGEQES